jgi:hypothetical protein
MKLIEKLKTEKSVVYFYDGIDFDKLIDHPTDGSDGFIFCFIDSWKNEMVNYNRTRRITYVLENLEYKDFDWKSINNEFISIYQTDGISNKSFYQIIRNKIINNQFENIPFIPTGGIKGGWKIK